jgi:hypothetical protein
MIPRILEYENMRVSVTAEAFTIPEIKKILDKYDMNAEPYLSYVYAMSAPDSAYINISRNEKSEAVIFDIQATLGEFDYNDPILVNAIRKLESLYTTKITALADQLGEELDGLRCYLRDTPITDGEGGNLRERIMLMKDIEKVSTSYSKVRKQADDEIKRNTKGGHELGDY